MEGKQTWRPVLQHWQRLLCLQGRVGRTRFENKHQKRLAYQSIQTHPLPQYLHLVNFLRLFHRTLITLIEIHIILLLIVITENALHLPPVPSRGNIVVSSPIAFGIGDNRDKLANYFNWLAGVYPTMEKQLQECLMILRKKG